MVDLAADAAAILADVLAVDATYTPSGGAGVAVRVIPRQADAVAGFAGSSVRVNTTIFQALTADIANPQDGDEIEVAGVTYRVSGDPERDGRRLIWTIEAVAQ